MELTKLKELIKEEVQKQIGQIQIQRIKDLELADDELLVFKLSGEFTDEQFKLFHQVLHERYGTRALAIGHDKDKNYNIEILTARWNDGKDS